MLGTKGFEGVYTLIKSLEALPFEKQEDFLKSQRNTLEGEIVVIRKGGSFCLDVVKAKGGEFSPEVAKKDDEDTIGDEGHVGNEGKATKSEEVDLEKGEGTEEDEKDDDNDAEEYEAGTKKAMESVAQFNRMFEEMEKSS